MKSQKKTVEKLGFFTLLFLISLISIVPFYFIISMATHTTSEIYTGQVFTFGSSFMDNVKTIIEGGFMRYFSNSLITAFLSSILCLFISSLAAYGIVIYQFKLKKSVSTFIVVSMMIPSQVSLIGYTIEVKSMHLASSLAPLVFIWGASAYGVFFMIQYMQSSIPKEIIESARIDGCNEFRIYYQIAMPLIKPAMGTLFMLIFLWSWNNFLMPSTLINKSSNFTIPLGIQTLATAYTQNWGARGAALTVAVLPILIIFAIGSKYFIKGLSAGAVKG